MSAIGILLQLAYRLRRHFIGGWSVARWLGLLFFLAVLSLPIAYRAITWQVGLAASLFLIYVGLLAWAGRKGFVHFIPAEADTLLCQALPDPPLRPEELVPVRASGLFTVEGKEQYYVDVEADYESVPLREHIVLARVYPSRFLLLGSWPDDELGWWYIFFQPDMLRQVRAGYLHFGRRPWPALEIVYTPDEKTRQTVYLAAEMTSLHRIWQDLSRDAPPAMSSRGHVQRVRRVRNPPYRIGPVGRLSIAAPLAGKAGKKPALRNRTSRAAFHSRPAAMDTFSSAGQSFGVVASRG